MPESSDNIAEWIQNTPDVGLQVSGETEISLLGASDPVFTDLKPDDFKAYIRFRIATAFPNVIGPEMHGRYFGFHPQVLVNSYRSLLHQQINLGHMLKSYGAYRDRIIGCAVGVAVGNVQRQPKQMITDSIETAQYLDVVAVVFKAAEGVRTMLGNHISSHQKQSVSIEAGGPPSTYGVYDPRDKSIRTLDQAMEEWPQAITVHREHGLRIGAVDGVQLAFAGGGQDGAIQFRGVGATPNPAEKRTAKIVDLKAELDMGGDMCMAASVRVEEWQPGQPVAWVPLVLSGEDAGRGTVVGVIEEGSVLRHGMRKTATAHDPLLEIRVSGKSLHVIRHASSIRKMES